MCIYFDGHHSGGSSFELYIIFDFVIRCGPYPQVQVRLKKKKKVLVYGLAPRTRFGSSNRVGPGIGV